MTALPQQLQINAWPGEDANRSQSDPGFKDRLLAGGLALRDAQMLGPVPIDDKDWTDDRVGWGLVLPDRDDAPEADRAAALDAPESLRDLLAARKGVVLRFRAGQPHLLRRYYADGTPAQDVLIGSQTFGTGVGAMPRYLLIYASPEAIPWAVQFRLQQSRFAGRIDLEGDALDRYVEALLGDWPESAVQRGHSVAWAVDHDPDDITHLMRNSVAAPIHAKFAADAEFAAGARFVDGANEAATGAALAGALAQYRPALVATTSHGMTGPLDDVPKMRADLGQFVDAARAQVRAGDLLAHWQPDGAIWYAHACCSAGSQAKTAFADLVPDGSDVQRVLTGVAACGETMAPFPRALLSAPKPLRAFIGHVEPTFDWSLRYPRTGQYLTQPLVDALYQRLFTGEPVGMALETCRRQASGLLHADYGPETDRWAEGGDAAGDVLALRLMANDWKALVLIGDPACRVA